MDVSLKGFYKISPYFGYHSQLICLPVRNTFQQSLSLL